MEGMDKELCTVSDVYEHAAAIGKDIEIIVQEYGKETIEDVMPKIVYVLEQLEGLAEQNEQDRERIAGLMLEREKHIIHANRDKAIQRQLEEKLAYMESLVSKDKKELEQRLKALETENECLVEELEKRDDEIVKERTNGGISSSFTFYSALSFSLSLIFSVSMTLYYGNADLRDVWGRLWDL